MMPCPTTTSILPRSIGVLVLVYTCASLAHFTHNAEFIEFYPNMPSWITRDTVYCAWLAVAATAVIGLVFARIGWPIAAAAALAVYGASGLDGLGHYALAVCSRHSFAANATIWAEAATGFALMLVAGGRAVNLLAARLGAHTSA
jgi:hypothetical protein